MNIKDAIHPCKPYSHLLCRYIARLGLKVGHSAIFNGRIHALKKHLFWHFIKHTPLSKLTRRSELCPAHCLLPAACNVSARNIESNTANLAAKTPAAFRQPGSTNQQQGLRQILKCRCPSGFSDTAAPDAGLPWDISEWLDRTDELRDRTKSNLRLRANIFANSVRNLRLADTSVSDARSRATCRQYSYNIAFCQPKANAAPSMISGPATPSRRFDFDRDTFAFANDLVWEYRDGAVSQRILSRRGDAERAYTHRCFVMVRSARQFFYHAQFDGTLPAAGEDNYRRLVRAVVSRSPRTACAAAGPVVMPGYHSLREFSRAQAAVLKANCGGAWQSYVLRSHWRMILPVSRRHQEKMAAQLVRSLPERGAVIVHLFRFPQLTINHGILLYDLTETDGGLKFSAYDPNCPGQPAELIYHRADRTFHLPRTHYWAGGKVNVVETFCGRLY